MEYLVTKREMQSYDTYTIEHIGIPALVLMERAALCVTNRVLDVLKSMNSVKPKVLCVCGVGNNGGDGLAVARMLADEGIDVDVSLIGNRDHCSKETEVQLAILDKYNIKPDYSMPDGNYDLVVDALFGTGLSREITGDYKEAIETINAMETYRMAIDMPSGINADTGVVLGTAVKADETVTVAFKKRGLYLYPGTEYAGTIHVAKIGITEKSFAADVPKMYTLSEELTALRPKRRADGNKGTFGKVLLVAGSGIMAGAALLSAESAYRTGAGMLKLVIPEKIRVIVQEKLPEALIAVYDSEDGLSETERNRFASDADWADVIAVGPGLSKHDAAKQLLELAIRTKKPMVLDADALNLLAENETLQGLLRNRENPCILTPHPGELARLLGKEITAVVENQIDCCREAVEKYNAIVVAKGARSVVCGGDTPDFLNTAGNDKMATAGSGDVLTGMVAALLGQGLAPKEAAVLGVYLHAKAGDSAAKQALTDEKRAPGIGILASDIVENI